MTFADAIGPTVTEVPPAGGRRRHADLPRSRRRVSATSSRTRRSSRGGGSSRRRTPSTASLGPELTRRLRRRPVRVEDGRPGDLVRVHWYEGERGVRGQGAQARRGRGPRHVQAARRHRDRAGRLLRLRQPGRLLRRARAGRPRERRGHGVRATSGRSSGSSRRTRSTIRWSPSASRTSSSTSSSTRRRPTRITARRAGSTRASPSTRARATARTIAAQVEAAAKSGTLIPLDGLTGQFPNGQDFFLAYSESVAAVDYMVQTYGSDALVTLDPLVRRRPDRRRGVQRRARARHDGLRRGVVQGRQRQGADRSTARSPRRQVRSRRPGPARRSVARSSSAAPAALERGGCGHGAPSAAPAPASDGSSGGGTRRRHRSWSSGSSR